MKASLNFFPSRSTFVARPYIRRYPSVTIVDWLWWRLYWFRK